MKSRVLFFSFLCGVPFLSLADQTTVVGCFSSGNINLKYVESSNDEALLAYVLYEKSSSFIPLAFIKKSEVPLEDRPSEFTITWGEIVDGKVNGSYEVATQGARFNSFNYKTKNNKLVEFKEKTEAYNSDWSDCRWVKKK